MVWHEGVEVGVPPLKYSGETQGFLGNQYERQHIGDTGKCDLDTVLKTLSVFSSNNYQ